LRLAQLETKFCEQLLSEKGLSGTDSDRAHLVEAYTGNPLALKIVAQTIVDLFGGEIAPFLNVGEIIFGNIRDLLSQQFGRLSALEQRILLWLGILREPATLNEIFALLVTPVPRVRLLESIEALHRSSLVEQGQIPGSFTLQSMVLEYVTTKLVEEAHKEIREGSLVHLVNHGLALAQTPEYVRQTQQRLIMAPIVTSLRDTFGQQAKIEERLVALLNWLKTWEDDQGYGPANLVVLLHMLRGNLRGLDLSHLTLRSMYMQGIQMQDTSLAGASIRDSIFTEPFDAMKAVAISRSGNYWAGSSLRGEVWIWESKGLSLRRIWIAHGDTSPALTFSPDERFLATCGGWDSTIKLWDVLTGKLLWTGRHTSHVNAVAFSPNGNMLSSSGNDATIRIWDSKSGTELQILPHPNPVCGLAWSPNEHIIASGDFEGNIRLWQIQEIAKPICVQTFEGHPKWIESLAFSPDGGTLATAGWERTVKLWDVSNGLLLQSLDGHTDRVSHVAWSPDGRILASCSRDKAIWLWDVGLNSHRAALQGHTTGIVGLAFTGDSSSLLSTGEDGTLRLWNVNSGSVFGLFKVTWIQSTTWTGVRMALISLVPVKIHW